MHVTPVVDYTRYDWDSPGTSRRSVYRFLFRTLPDPFYDALDSADASQLTAVRNESTTPLQALVLLNNPFVLRQCEHFARAAEQRSRTPTGALAHRLELAYGRTPTADEAESPDEPTPPLRLAESLPAAPQQQRVSVRELMDRGGSSHVRHP